MSDEQTDTTQGSIAAPAVEPSAEVPTEVPTEVPAEAPSADTAPPEDLDAVDAAADDAAEPEPLPDVDPLVLVEGQVPLYNPFYAPVEVPYNGEVYTIRAGGVDLAPLAAVDLAVGADNGGGKLSHTGLRRLYGPEPRFATAAEAAGLDLVAWCEARNAAIEAEAEAAAAGYAAKIGAQLGGSEE